MALIELQNRAFVTFTDVERAIAAHSLPTQVHSLEEAQVFGREATAHAVSDKYGPTIALYYVRGIIAVEVHE